MKRYSTFIVLLACTFVTAQNSDDVLRYSNENLQGTARFQAMGGAFGALGGDLSALNINPAGSAVFNNHLFTFSATAYNNDNSAGYFGTNSNNKRNTIDLNQAGGVLVFKSTDPKAGWNKIAIAANYDIVENFANRISINGFSNQGIDNYFLDFATGAPFNTIFLQEGETLGGAYLAIGNQQGFADQQAFLGFEGGVIDPADPDNETGTEYVPVAEYDNVRQNLLRNISGHNSKFTVNFASQYREILNIGAALNFHTILYDRSDRFTETGYNADSPIQRTTFDNLLRTEGSGFSFSLGAITKVNEVVRLGASYQSPTWYRLTDDLSQSVTTDLAALNFIENGEFNLFPRYTLMTPSKLTGSAAFVFGKNGLLSVDYSYQDMSNAELGPAGEPEFDVVNNDVANIFGTVSTIRIGGEYRIERFSLRGGYRFEQSPYVNTNLMGDLNVLSGGVGYDFGKSRLDFALSRAERDSSQRLFDTGLNTPALINAINTNATLSYTVNF